MSRLLITTAIIISSRLRQSQALRPQPEREKTEITVKSDPTQRGKKTRGPGFKCGSFRRHRRRRPRQKDKNICKTSNLKNQFCLVLLFFSQFLFWKREGSVGYSEPAPLSLSGWQVGVLQIALQCTLFLSFFFQRRWYQSTPHCRLDKGKFLDGWNSWTIENELMIYTRKEILLSNPVTTYILSNLKCFQNGRHWKYFKIVYMSSQKFLKFF